MIHLRYKGWQYNGHWYTLKKNKLPFLCIHPYSSTLPQQWMYPQHQIVCFSGCFWFITFLYGFTLLYYIYVSYKLFSSPSCSITLCVLALARLVSITQERDSTGLNKIQLLLTYQRMTQIGLCEQPLNCKL